MTAWFLAGCLVGAMFGFTLGAFIVGLLSAARKADDQAHAVMGQGDTEGYVESFEELYGYSFRADMDRAPDPVAVRRRPSSEVQPPPHNPLRGHSLRRYPPTRGKATEKEGLPGWLDGISPS
jgi:hypothetical protein